MFKSFSNTSYPVVNTTNVGVTSIPNVVLNGLVLFLDSADPASYTSGSTIWYDRSGRNNHITLFNDVTFVPISQSLYFDGTDAYGEMTLTSALLSSNSGIPFGDAPCTIQSWIRILSCGGPGTWVSWGAAQTGNNTRSCYCDYGALNGAVSGSIGRWANHTAVYRGNGTGYVTLAPYTSFNYNINNALSAATVFSNALFNTDVSNVRVGRQNALGNTYFTGYIKQVAVYNRALTTQEITSNYNNYSGSYSI